MSKANKPAGLTEAEFLKLTPREQDAFVAKHVLGLGPPVHQLMNTGLDCLPVDIYTCANCDFETDSRTDTEGCEYHAPYTTDIAAAWEIVEKLESDGWDSEHESYYSPSKGRGYRFGFRRTKNQEIVHLTFSDNLPLSLCLAALKAAGALAP